ncbi:miraculin-like protein [Tanacetum coccineum]|uniref:Miraculin-like protein n=1 Tax=Tanacetum coccineum TaxID=301880 RepID=A0ABQ4Z538_9ASTR
MNTTTLFLLAFILFFALSANSAPSPSPVLDAYGKNLQTGVAYYVMPAPSDRERGGLFFAAVGNFTCPAGVAQGRTDGAYGDPLIFTPVNPKKGVIHLSTDVNVKFLGSTICHESNVWKFKYDKNIKQYAVMMGSVEGNPGPETLDNWFEIEKTKDGYNLARVVQLARSCSLASGVQFSTDRAIWHEPEQFSSELNNISLNRKKGVHVFKVARRAGTEYLRVIPDSRQTSSEKVNVLQKVTLKVWDSEGGHWKDDSVRLESVTSTFRKTRMLRLPRLFFKGNEAASNQGKEKGSSSLLETPGRGS